MTVVRVPLEDRLWRMVNRDGPVVVESPCWVYTGFTSPRTGHAKIAYYEGDRKKSLAVHRVAYEIQVGPIPEGLMVRHRCDIPNCVRGDHLLLGSAQDSVDDMMRRGANRAGRVRGSTNARASVTESQVIHAKRLLAAGVRNRDVSNETGLNRNVVQKIKSGESWSWLTPPPVSPIVARTVLPVRQEQ